MANPFNPLHWIKSAQDWFAKTERSSGFRPFLIYQLLSMEAGISLVSLFPTRPMVEIVGLILIVVPVVTFVPLYAWKAHSDPDFCRSETHIQRLKKLKLEIMGSESRQIEGEILEQQALTASEKDTSVLPEHSTKVGDE